MRALLATKPSPIGRPEPVGVAGPPEEEAETLVAFPSGAELAYARWRPPEVGVSDAARDAGIDAAVLCSRRFSAVSADGRGADEVCAARSPRRLLALEVVLAALRRSNLSRLACSLAAMVAISMDCCCSTRMWAASTE